MPGTRSQLHVDNSFLPFWLTLLAGRKVFRAVERGHWSPALVDRGVVDDDGDAEFALDWYDDDAVLDAVGGADVYSSVLEPGDSVYIPVAALHGGSNVGDGLCGNQPVEWTRPAKLQTSLSRPNRSRFG